MALSGTCKFCGQSMVINEEKYPFLDPDDLAAVDEIVTGLCDCPQAKSERRKEETKQKIENFIETEVDVEAQDFVRAAVEMVRGQRCDSAMIQTNDGWRISIKLSKDYELVFSCKKSLSKKAVF